MLHLSERLQQNIAFVLRRSKELEEQSAAPSLLRSEKLAQLCYAASELALRALICSDELESLHLSREDRLFQQEAAFVLQQIALHALDIQEWEAPNALQEGIAEINRQAELLKGYVDFPAEPASQEPPAQDPAPLVLSADTSPASVLEWGLTVCIEPPEGDEQARLRAEIRVLREMLATLVLERDELLHVTCRELEARYFSELGSLEAELFRAKGLARYYKRLCEFMRAAVNRGEEPSSEKAEEALRRELEEFQPIYEDLLRRVREARAFRPRRTRCSKIDNIGSQTGSAASEEKELSEEEQLKLLYRRIVKAMHPDLHPDQDEATRALFKRAIQAYKDGDLKTLREIDGLSSGAEPDPGQDPLQALREERARLLELVASLRAEIRHVKSHYPYTKKDLLEDPERLAAEKQRLQEQLRQAQQQADRYRREMEELEGKA